MRRARATTTLVALVTALVLALGGCTSGGGDVAVTHNAADVSFVEAMIPHHQQALDLVALTEGRDLDPGFTVLAQEIRVSQDEEIDRMSRWRQQWAAAAAAAGGGDGGGSGGGEGGLSMGGDMGGMMSAQQLERLAGARDGSFRRLWLQSMIEHHQGSLAMAESELEAGRAPDALALAEEIRDAHGAEIVRMQALLAG